MERAAADQHSERIGALARDQPSGDQRGCQRLGPDGRTSSGP
jgi:hypothetical protein